MSEPAMRKARPRIRSRCLALGALVLALAGSARGLSTDRDQPIEIEADFVEVEDQLGVAVYRGKVVVTQGTMRFTGDILTVTYTPGQDIKEALLEGKPAHFKQRPDNEERDMEAWALNMRYEVQKDLVHLIEQAKVVQRGQTYTGHRMIYDRVKNILTAYGAAPGERGVSGQPLPAERVRILIPPKEREKSPKKPKKQQ